MKINWKIRIKNPTFWFGIGAAVIVPILAYLGLNWSDMTSWAILWNTLLEAVKNPVILVAVAISVYNAVIDPTTKGISDSKQALNYTEPKGDE